MGGVRVDRDSSRLEMTWSARRALAWRRLLAGVPAVFMLGGLGFAGLGGRGFAWVLGVCALLLVVSQLSRILESTHVVAQPGLLQLSNRRLGIHTEKQEFRSAEIAHVAAVRIDGHYHVHAWIGEGPERVAVVSGLDSRAEANRIATEVREFMELPIQAGDLPGQPRQSLVRDTLRSSPDPSSADSRAVEAELRDAVSLPLSDDEWEPPDVESFEPDG